MRPTANSVMETMNHRLPTMSIFLSFSRNVPAGVFTLRKAQTQARTGPATKRFNQKIHLCEKAVRENGNRANSKAERKERAHPICAGEGSANDWPDG